MIWTQLQEGFKLSKNFPKTKHPPIINWVARWL